MENKKEALIQKALEASQNGDWETAELINDQIDAIDKKVLTTPNKDEGETKVKKKSEVLNKLAKDVDKKDPVLKEKPADEINTKGEQSSPEEKKKTEGLLEGLFGDLFDKKELARMAVMYLGGRALGGSHQGSLGYAAKSYIGRLDAKAATQAATKKELLKSGKYTPASIEAYAESGDATDLIAAGSPVTQTGQFKTFYKGGRKVRATQVKSGKNTYWITPDGKKVNASYTEDASAVRGTPEYSKRIKNDSAAYGTMIKDLRTNFGTTKIKDAADIYATELAPSVAGRNIAKWAADENVPAEYMGNIVENAYHSAIEHSKITGEKVRDLTPFLEEQYVIAKVGSAELFKDTDGKQISGTNVSRLIDSAQAAANNLGGKVSSTQIIQGYRKAWNELDTKTRDQWEAKATGGENGFMKFMNADINKSLQ